MDFLVNVLPTRSFDGKHDEIDEDHGQCSICLMDYEINDILSSSHNPKCLHLFHRDCIQVRLDLFLYASLDHFDT
jgi:hypothetical protein